MSGPLHGIRIVMMGGLGPAPFCGMLLGDLGADVVRVDRIEEVAQTHFVDRVVRRSQRSIAIDVKDERGAELVRSLVAGADGFVDVFRPGALERLGLGPDDLLARNARLVYARMTGYGQDGPFAPMAGHDINYIAMAGALHAIGTPETPVAPLNLVGDYGGGGMLLAVGLLSGILKARQSGRGQVVDVAMVDGVATSMGVFYGLFAEGRWEDRRCANVIDGAAHYYRTYETADAEHVAVGAMEKQFYDELCRRLGVHVPQGDSPETWVAHAEVMAARFGQKTRAEWEAELVHPQTWFDSLPMEVGARPLVVTLAQADVTMSTIREVFGHPRVSVNSVTSYRQPLAADIALWCDLGVEHVALILPKIDDIGWDTAREMVTSARLRVSTIFGPTYRPLDADRSLGWWDADQKGTVDTVEFAASIGAASVYVCSGGAPTLTWDEAADAFCEMVAPAVARGAELGVPLLLEPTNPLRADISFVFWQRDAMDLARQAGTKVMLDLQSCWYERGLEQVVRQNMDLVGLTQISDFVIGTTQTGDRVVPGDGDIPLERLLAMVLDAGFEGSFDLEVMGPRVEEEGYQSSVRRSVERASELLDRLGA